MHEGAFAVVHVDDDGQTARLIRRARLRISDEASTNFAPFLISWPQKVASQLHVYLHAADSARPRPFMGNNRAAITDVEKRTHPKDALCTERSVGSRPFRLSNKCEQSRLLLSEDFILSQHLLPLAGVTMTLTKAGGLRPPG